MTSRLPCAVLSDLGRYLAAQEAAADFDLAIDREQHAIMGDEERARALAERLLDSVMLGTDARVLPSLLDFIAQELIVPSFHRRASIRKYKALCHVADAMLEAEAIEAIKEGE